MFGFSRGAYTIRALAGMIEYCAGKIKISDLKTNDNKTLEKIIVGLFKEYVKYGFKSYPKKSCNSEVKNKTETYDKIKINFIGVWDTVGAIGAPFKGLRDAISIIFKKKFTDNKLSGIVEYACQALAIDEDRLTYEPELWLESDSDKEGKIKQVWFAGVHSNVGGGYSRQGMSLVALDWIMAEAESHGLKFIKSDRSYVKEHQDVNDKLYNAREGIKIIFRWKPRNIKSLCSEKNVKPKIHISVFERILNRTEGYNPGNIPVDFEVISTEKALYNNLLNGIKDCQKNIKEYYPSEDMQKEYKKIIFKGKASYYMFLFLLIIPVLIMLLQIISKYFLISFWLRIIILPVIIVIFLVGNFILKKIIQHYYENKVNTISEDKIDKMSNKGNNTIKRLCKKVITIIKTLYLIIYKKKWQILSHSFVLMLILYYTFVFTPFDIIKISFWERLLLLIAFISISMFVFFKWSYDIDNELDSLNFKIWVKSWDKFSKINKEITKNISEIFSITIRIYDSIKRRL